MHYRTTSTDFALACGAWAATVLTFLAAALVLILGGGRWGIYVAEVGCGLSALAAVVHIRYYSARLSELVRNMGREEIPASRLQSVP